MSDRDQEDRWRSLAEELGLSPEPTNDPAAVPPPIAKIAVAVASAPPPPPVDKPPPPEPVAPRASEPPPLDEPFELPSITSLDPPILDPMPEASLDRETLHEDPLASSGPADTERPRGRGGRRGGQRGGRGRNDRDAEPRGEPGAPMRPPSGPPEEGRDDRSRRGRGGRRPPERRPEPEREEVPELEEVMSELEPAFVPAAEVDDGPEDNLADLNVPSWSDLIASLYRPER